jgi:hypothetical protein
MVNYFSQNDYHLDEMKDNPIDHNQYITVDNIDGKLDICNNK